VRRIQTRVRDSWVQPAGRPASPTAATQHSPAHSQRQTPGPCARVLAGARIPPCGKGRRMRARPAGPVCWAPPEGPRVERRLALRPAAHKEGWAPGLSALFGGEPLSKPPLFANPTPTIYCRAGTGCGDSLFYVCRNVQRSWAASAPSSSLTRHSSRPGCGRSTHACRCGGTPACHPRVRSSSPFAGQERGGVAAAGLFRGRAE
jgi:hypothetical protein